MLYFRLVETAAAYFNEIAGSEPQLFCAGLSSCSVTYQYVLSPVMRQAQFPNMEKNY